MNAAVVGNGTIQRSRVDQLQVTFDGEVVIETDAFTIQRRGAAGGVVDTIFTAAINASGQTVATISFSGAVTRGLGALLDGNYQLTIDGTKVSRGSTLLDGARIGQEGSSYQLGTAEVDGFFARFADTSGDRSVTLAEFSEFRRAFSSTSPSAAYNELFDYDLNGTINLSDFSEFRRRFGTRLNFE